MSSDLYPPPPNVKGSKLIKVGIDTFRKPENGEQRRDMLLVLMSVLL